MGLVTKEFTSSGTWTCPAGVTSVILRGFGGGGGGAYRSTSNIPSGGAAAGMGHQAITVIPNTSYTITIGAGGAGASVTDTNGGQGGDTSFGGLHSFQGAAGSHYRGGFTSYNLGMSGGGGGSIGYNAGISNTNYIGGTDSTHGGAGGGGGAGIGGDGAGTGTSGGSGGANTGAGGGSSDSSGTGGGAGGSGWLQIIWFEG